MQIIYPDSLHQTASFPQCTDNQYVSLDVFAELVADSSTDYNTPSIARQRLADLNTELIRSLIYTNEVVINRAFLINNHLLYPLYYPKHPRSSPAFVELAQEGIVLPLLFKHVADGQTISVDDFVGDYQTTDHGLVACHHLIEQITGSRNGRILALAREKPVFDQLRENVYAGFEENLLKTYNRSTQKVALSNMYCDVFPYGIQDDNGQPLEYSKASEQLREMLLAASDLPNKRSQTRRCKSKHPFSDRSEVYGSFLITKCFCGRGLEDEKCTCIADGKFDTITDPVKRQATFGAKALVDLVYAANIPDRIKRFVFTPRELPTRRALQDLVTIGGPSIAQFDDVAQATLEVSRVFQANMNEAFALPDLSSLAFDDVQAIRSLPQWEPFIEGQTRILKHPLEAAREFQGFQDLFTDLQNAIAKYCKDAIIKGKDIRTRPHFSFVSGAITVIGRVVRIGVSLKLSRDGMHPAGVAVIDLAIEQVAKCVDNHIQVGPARLMFELIDANTRKVDRAKSWSVDWMSQYAVYWEKNETLDFLRKVKAGLKEARSKLVDPAPGMSNAGTTPAQKN